MLALWQAHFERRPIKCCMCQLKLMWQVAGGRWQVAGGRWQVAGGRWPPSPDAAVCSRSWSGRTCQFTQQYCVLDAASAAPPSHSVCCSLLSCCCVQLALQALSVRQAKGIAHDLNCRLESQDSRRESLYCHWAAVWCCTTASVVLCIVAHCLLRVAVARDALLLNSMINT